MTLLRLNILIIKYFLVYKDGRGFNCLLELLPINLLCFLCRIVINNDNSLYIVKYPKILHAQYKDTS